MRKSNPPSNIPKARELLRTGMKLKDWDYVRAALALMTRAKAIRRARQKQGKITDAQKREARRILLQEPDTHMHEIANRTGIRNSGRISEIANGLRK